MTRLLPILLCACTSPAPPAPPPAPPAAAKAPKAPKKTVSTLDRVNEFFAARDAMDKTLWAPEELAQEHELSVIALWDQLRKAAEPEAILAAFPVGALSLGALGEAQSLLPRVTRRAQAVPHRSLDQAGWRAFVEARKAEGWRLVQSEWHHVRFEPEPPRSTFNIELHLEQRDTARAIVRGPLKIEWHPKPVEGARQPSRIDATALEVLTRTGPVAFEELGVFPMGSDEPKPVLVQDLDDDGRPEVLLPATNAVYRSTAEGAFEGGPLFRSALPGRISAAALADLTGDGRLDLLVAARDHDKVTRLGLYVGAAEGFGAPVEIHPKPIDWVRAFAIGDIDRDGDLDVYVSQYRGTYNRGVMPVPFHDAENSYPDLLLRNDGELRFTDIVAEAGISKPGRHSQATSFVDLDDDGDLDLVNVADFAGIDLYLNEGGRFRLANERMQDRNLFGMSLAVADFDGDARPDLFATGMSSSTVRRLNGMGLSRKDVPDYARLRTQMTYGNRLLLNRGERLVASPFADQVAASGWTWGSTALDWNNDGRPDLFVANGFISGETAQDYCTDYWRHDVYYRNELEPEVSKLAMGALVERFKSVSWNGFEHDRLYTGTPQGFVEGGFLFGLGHEQDARNVVRADLDGDGRVDLLFSDVPRAGRLQLRVLRNRHESKAHWIGAKLRGVPGRSPIGAKVSVHAGGRTRAGWIVTGDTYVGQQPRSVHLGLGSTAKVDWLEVRWPDGKKTRLETPGVDRYHRIQADSAR